MREDRKKNIQEKKTFDLFSEKLMRATKLKTIGHISEKVNEGDKIKKTFDLF